MAEPHPLVVVALDIGTTYSGYAFSFRHEFLDDKLKITTNKVWQDGSNHLQTSYKTPTSVLVDPEGQFQSFGYEAETKYSELAKTLRQKQWLLFRRFKMTLYNRKVDDYMELESVSGKRFNALTVFAMSIRYLKEHFGQSLLQQFTDSEIQYVLTVPAIWDEDAKQFMRKAAVQAGISPQRLTLALEPEAASVFFRVLSSINSYEFDGPDISKPGSRYIVVDAGGGTVDTTVHEVMSSGELKELHKASGGDWGGTQVDDRFTELLLDIFTVKVMKEFGKNHESDWLELEKEFEINKRKVSGDGRQITSFRVPTSLRAIFNRCQTCSLEEHIAVSRFAGLVWFIGDKMRVSGKVMQELMKPTIQKIVTHAETLTEDPKCRGISHILLVGGFSDSPYLQETFRKNFQSVTVVTPRDAVLSVMKGAVIFGHHPGAISIRVARCTYGVRCWPLFDDTEHDKGKMVIVDGKRYCRDVFKTFIEVGEEVPCYKEFDEEIFTPVHDYQETMSLPVYKSTEKAPKYITDVSCQRLGKFDVTLPTLTGDGARDMGVRFVLGDTSLRIKAEEKATGNVTEATFSFM